MTGFDVATTGPLKNYRFCCLGVRKLLVAKLAYWFLNSRFLVIEDLSEVKFSSTLGVIAV